MNQFLKQLSCYALTILSTFVFSLGHTATEITFPSNQPVILTNMRTTTINLMCVIRVSPPQSISIYIIRGSGSFNGTTFNPGYTMNFLLYNGQSIPIMATKGTQAKVTNLGSNELKVVC